MQPLSPARFISLFVLFAVIVGGLFFASGNKPSPEPPEPPTPPPFPPKHAEQIRSGIKEFLGKGYLGYDLYANSDSCTYALFDLADESHVDIHDGTGWNGRFASGESKTELFEEYFGTAKLSGKHGGFSGEITTSFKSSALRNRSHSFATANITQTYYRLTLLESAPLKEEVATDLNEMEPVALFDKYGTHYLKSIYIGGRVSFSSFIDRSTVSTNFKIEAGVDAAYGESVSGSASGGGVDKKDIEQINTNKTLLVRGGDPAEAAKIMTGTGEPSENYAKWSKSVPDHMTISDIANKGMIPIYMLVENAERQAELEAAWISYMEEHTDDVLKEGEPEVIKKTSQFFAKEFEGGRNISVAPYHWNWEFYYPTISNDAVTLQFDSGSNSLEDKDIVLIKTTEDTFKDSWKDYVYLGSFKKKNNSYYWIEYGAKTDWRIERVVPANDKRIRFGDQVMIKNIHFDQYLAPTKDGFLTTAAEEFIWTLEAVPTPDEE